MRLKPDFFGAVLLAIAFSVSTLSLFTTTFPFVVLFSCSLLFTVGVFALGRTVLSFWMGVLLTVCGIVLSGRLTGYDGAIAITLLVVLWSNIGGLYWFNQSRKKRRWKNLMDQDEEAKEIKNLRQEITQYEERKISLEKRTSQRRLLSAAARELGALLDPQRIQSKLLEFSQMIFPGQQVELSYGQHRDGWDRVVFQKRQPLLVPSEEFKGVPLLAVPVSVQRSVVGVLRVGGQGLAEPAKPFSREDLRQLDTLASLASLAMDNCQLFQQVQQSALRDNLTGLLTQRVFQEKLEAAILEASRYNQQLSLILADVDHFKMVNDQYGHPAGDQVLQGFAHILDRNVRDVDVIARYGGEEFAILIFQTDHKSALQISEQIRADLSEQTFESEHHSFAVTSSFGVATFPEDATSAQQLFRQADQRLYKAKHAGRNRTQGRLP